MSVYRICAKNAEIVIRNTLVLFDSFLYPLNANIKNVVVCV